MLFTVPKAIVSLLNLMIMQKSSVDFSNIVNANVAHMEKLDKSGMKQVQDKLLLEHKIRQINLQHNSLENCYKIGKNQNRLDHLLSKMI